MVWGGSQVKYSNNNIIFPVERKTAIRIICPHIINVFSRIICGMFKTLKTNNYFSTLKS